MQFRIEAMNGLGSDLVWAILLCTEWDTCRGLCSGTPINLLDVPKQTLAEWGSSFGTRGVDYNGIKNNPIGT